MIRRIFEEYRHRLAFEVLSGGMILPEKPRPIGVIAPYIQKTYPEVESLTGIRFGKDWLWHIFHPDQSDWFPDSRKAAVAMAIFKEYDLDEAILFATDLEYALHEEGRDPSDNESYRHLLEKYRIPEMEFFEKLRSPVYLEKAKKEFDLVSQLGVTGFPTAFLQVSESKAYLLCRGYSAYETLQARIEEVLKF